MNLGKMATPRTDRLHLRLRFALGEPAAQSTAAQSHSERKSKRKRRRKQRLHIDYFTVTVSLSQRLRDSGHQMFLKRVTTPVTEPRRPCKKTKSEALTVVYCIKIRLRLRLRLRFKGL